MDITMFAIGTRGDVQPILVYGRALHRRGHRVRVAAAANFAPWIKQHGLEFTPSQLDMQAIMSGPGGQEWAEHGTNLLRQGKIMKRLLAEMGPQFSEDIWTASQGADLLISSFTTDLFALSIVEKLRIPLLRLMFQPSMLATRYGPSTAAAMVPHQASILNYWFGKTFTEPFMWQVGGKIANTFRTKMLGLAPINKREFIESIASTPTIHAYSQHISPHADDWPKCYHTTGFLFLDEGQAWQPSAELEAFLAAGEPPIAVGFGSMVGRNSERIPPLVVAAARQAKKRVVLLGGWAGHHGISGDDVFVLDSAPHDWLFPRMSAAVHHGGAGTTAASLRAGLPTIIVPHLGDQLFWGRRITALGIGPKAITRPKLTAEGLAAAIKRTDEPTMRHKAAEVGRKIQAENGVEAALAVTEREIFQHV